MSVFVCNASCAPLLPFSNWMSLFWGGLGVGGGGSKVCAQKDLNEGQVQQS